MPATGPATRRTAGFRRCAAALFALVLGFFIVGPGFDSLLCHADAGSAAAATIDDIGHDAHDDGPAFDACAHGACHHLAPYAPSTPHVASTKAITRVLARAPPQAFRPYDLLHGLERPPRD